MGSRSDGGVAAERRETDGDPFVDLERAFGLPHSRWVDLGGPVHYREWAGPGGEAPTFVLVHGLGGSHLNWMGVAPALAERARVVALDLAGFGRTPLAGRSASVFANRRLLSWFLRDVVGEPAVLFGNSMGGAIALLQAGVEPSSARGLVLTDPVLPWAPGGFPAAIVIAAFGAYRIPRVGERFVNARLSRFTSEELWDQTMRVVAADPRTIPDEIRRAHVALAESRKNLEDASPAFLEAARSVVSLGTRRKLVRRVMDRVACPVLIVHGDRDRLVPVAYAQAVVRRRPSWELIVLHGTGHAPMLEAPSRWLDAVLPWLGRTVLARPPT